MSQTRTQAWKKLIADGAHGPTMEHPIPAIQDAIVFKKGECMLNGGTRSSVNVTHTYGQVYYDTKKSEEA
ncbi:hypothetical protein OIDMADRAFT_20688 [Oidiodendron maius Zn]|uniref:Uncharacterized protein n=1 Tax=Oidiodendron maius (strain Zn) TaxID=913774 RepID=A0A0C3H0Q5_OIDMZ|nr:hypothetical protein OIDMADRAFT_20688 [Oidiodendron maius Zn]